MTVHWVGDTDLEIEFIVTDSTSNTPLRGARVEVHSDGGFYDEDYKQDFTLLTDAEGVASKNCRGSMCFGTESGLGLTVSTFVVHLPFWKYRVIADGYEPLDWTELDVPEQIRKVQRIGSGTSKLTVLVPMRSRHN